MELRADFTNANLIVKPDFVWLGTMMHNFAIINRDNKLQMIARESGRRELEKPESPSGLINAVTEEITRALFEIQMDEIVLKANTIIKDNDKDVKEDTMYCISPYDFENPEEYVRYLKRIVKKHVKAMVTNNDIVRYETGKMEERVKYFKDAKKYQSFLEKEYVLYERTKNHLLDKFMETYLSQNLQNLQNE